jgi:hypothetical protein
VKTSTAWLLARPRTAAGRTRTRLIAAGTAAAGGLLLAALAILRVPSTEPTQTTGASFDPRFSALVTHGGLKPGVITAILLLVVPALALTWQAVTTGSARRAAIQRGLHLAGATPADLRRVSALEPAVAGLLGGMLAGPVYLLLWLVLGPGVPARMRLLPDLSAVDALAWAAVALFTALLAAAAGARSATPRTRRPVRPWTRLAGVAVGVAAVWMALQEPVDNPVLRTVSMCVAVTVLLLALLSTGSIWVTSKARRLSRTGRPVDLLAAGGLRTLAGPAGRTAGTVFTAGLTLGIAAALLGISMAPQHSFSDALPGVLLTILAGALAALVAVTAMTLAATDDLVTTSRALASTAALGAEPAVLERVQRRRLEVVTLGPMAAGLLLGGVGYPALGGSFLGVGTALIAATVALLLIRGITSLVTRLLRPRIMRAADPASLRVA